jgi:hypothetical protein
MLHLMCESDSNKAPEFADLRWNLTGGAAIGNPARLAREGCGPVVALIRGPCSAPGANEVSPSHP